MTDQEYYDALIAERRNRMLGKSASSVSYGNDAGSRSMSFVSVSMAKLEAEIAVMEKRLGLESTTNRGPIYVC